MLRVESSQQLTCEVYFVKGDSHVPFFFGCDCGVDMESGSRSVSRKFQTLLNITPGHKSVVTVDFCSALCPDYWLIYLKKEPVPKKMMPVAGLTPVARLNLLLEKVSDSSNFS